MGGLESETMLHPLDSFTAFTLRKNEVIYNQSPLTLPLPSWAWWGVTDDLTVEIDLLPLVGGLFTEPFLPVPSVDVRYKLRDGTGGWDPWVAYETMFQYLYVEHNQASNEVLFAKRRGGSWFHRLNSSFKIGESTYVHASAGFTYTHSLVLENSKNSGSRAEYRDRVFPDFSLGLDLRMKRWASTHLTLSYGSTFVYLDNVPTKLQIAYGFRFAPFLERPSPFLKTMRIELAALHIAFPQIEAEMSLPFPLLPYFYWQWMW